MSAKFHNARAYSFCFVPRMAIKVAPPPLCSQALMDATAHAACPALFNNQCTVILKEFIGFDVARRTAASPSYPVAAAGRFEPCQSRVIRQDVYRHGMEMKSDGIVSTRFSARRAVLRRKTAVDP